MADIPSAMIFLAKEAGISMGVDYIKYNTKLFGETITEFVEKIITAKDRELEKEKRIYNQILNSIATLEVYENKESLQKEEKDALDKALKNLEKINPEVTSAYRQWKSGKISSEEYKNELNKFKKIVNNKNDLVSFEINEREIKELDREAKKIKNNLDNQFYHIFPSGKFKKLSYEEGIKQKKHLELLDKNSGKYNLEKYEEIEEEYKKYEGNLERIEKLRMENEIAINNIRKNKGFKISDSIKNSVVLTETKQENNKEMKMFDFIEKERLASTALTETKQEKNKTDNSLNNKKYNQLSVEPVVDLTAEEKYKQEELKINAKYNKEVLDETEAFNKKIKELLKSKNINEIQEAKKNHEKKLEMLEEENKIKLLNHQKTKPGATKIDIENLDTKIKMLEIEAEKEKNINKINQIEIEIKASEEAKLSNINNMGTGLKNLTSMFQMLGDVTGKQSIKDISNVLGTGSSLFDFLNGNEIGKKWLTDTFGSNAIPSLDNFNFGNGIGNIISGALGGGTEGNLGSMIGSGIGTAISGPVGSIVGGAIGSIGGSIFGSKSKKKKKREERKRKAAQERLKRGLISGQYKWQDVVEAYNEDLLKLGTGSYIDLYDKVSANTDYDNVLSSLNGAKSGSDGMSMITLKQLMPQYNEQQIIDWFKSLTGGAVLKGDILSTGEGKYGAIDIGELAKQVTNANRDLEKTLKTTIKGIINFSADSLAAVVKKGFFGGMEDLGNDIESMLAESLKNAFVNTEMSKALFNGMSDKVSDVVKEMFVKDGNLGIDLETGDLENLSLTQYMELIKKYTEISNEKLEELFRELGLNMDNLTGSMNNLNKNMSKNTVQGMATNLWRYNLGQNVTSEFNGVFEVEIPIILGDQLLDKKIIKITSDSIRKARRNKF